MKSLTFLASPIKQELSETIKPTIDSTNPNVELVDDKMNAMPNNEMEIPKRDRRIISLPKFPYTNFIQTVEEPTKLS